MLAGNLGWSCIFVIPVKSVPPDMLAQLIYLKINEAEEGGNFLFIRLLFKNSQFSTDLEKSSVKVGEMVQSLDSIPECNAATH